MQKIGGRALERFSSQKFHFEIFPKTNAISITFGPRYSHGQSLKEIDFPTRNAVDRFLLSKTVVYRKKQSTLYPTFYKWKKLYPNFDKKKHVPGSKGL